MAAEIPTTTISDAELIDRSLDDPQRFGSLFDRHAPAVRAYLRVRVGRADADGLVVDTFSAAFRARAGFDGRSADALPWLLGFARNLARNHHRAGRRLADLRSRLRTAERRETFDGDALARLDAERVGARVRATVAELPTAQQEVLVLHAVAGLSYAQIAELLDIPVGTVRSRLARARGHLRVELADLAPEDDADG